jgi:hypothetical protein
VGNPEGKRPLGRPRRRWADNIKIDLREIGWNGGDWIDLAQDRDQWRALVKAAYYFPLMLLSSAQLHVQEVDMLFRRHYFLTQVLK